MDLISIFIIISIIILVIYILISSIFYKNKKDDYKYDFAINNHSDEINKIYNFINNDLKTNYHICNYSFVKKKYFYKNTYYSYSGIYMIYYEIDDLNKIKNKYPFYIGESKNCLKRWNKHLWRYELVINKKNYSSYGFSTYQNLYKLVKKYNLDYQKIKFVILEKCPINELPEKENYWINYFSSYHIGLNQTKDGKYH